MNDISPTVSRSKVYTFKMLNVTSRDTNEAEQSFQSEEREQDPQEEADHPSLNQVQAVEESDDC